MTLHANLTGAYTAIKTLLEGDTAVMAALPGGINPIAGADGTITPFCQIYRSGTNEDPDMGVRSGQQEIIFLIKVISYGNDGYTVGSVAMDAIDNLINYYPSLSVTGYSNVLSLARYGSGMDFEDKDHFFNFIQYYRLWLQF